MRLRAEDAAANDVRCCRMPGRGGLATVIGWGRGDRFALRLLHSRELDARRRVLPALKALDGVLAAAESRLHLFGIVAGKLDGAV